MPAAAQNAKTASCRSSLAGTALSWAARFTRNVTLRPRSAPIRRKPRSITARVNSVSTKTPAKRSRCVKGRMGLTCNWAKKKAKARKRPSLNGRLCPKGWTRKALIWSARRPCCRCRASSASTRSQAWKSAPTSAVSGRSFNAAAPMLPSKMTTTMC